MSGDPLSDAGPSSSAEELMGLLMRAASQHSGEHFQDDASLIVLKAI